MELDLEEVTRRLNDEDIDCRYRVDLFGHPLLGIVMGYVPIGPEVFELLMPVSTLDHQVPDGHARARIMEAARRLAFRDEPFVLVLRGNWAKPQMIFQVRNWDL